MHTMIWYNKASTTKKFPKPETILRSFESMKTVVTFIAHITPLAHPLSTTICLLVSKQGSSQDEVLYQPYFVHYHMTDSGCDMYNYEYTFIVVFNCLHS